MTAATARCQLSSVRRTARRALVLASVFGLWSGPAAAQTTPPDSVAALTAPPGAMAEATITADPADPDRLAAAADPYLDPVRILVTQSLDGGVTWGLPLTIVPPGFTKSYDPVLGFDAAGELMVVGGASGEGVPHCQPGSAIFAATVRGAGVDYTVDYSLVRDARADGAYVDRPGLVVNRGGTVHAFATWTESTGVRAECRATPARSTIMLARLGSRGSVRDVHPLAAGAMRAPFGAALGMSDDGTLDVAIGDHGDGRTRLVMLRSADEGATWSAPAIIDDGPDVALTVPGIGGVVAPIPSLATTGDRVAVAWNKGALGGPDVAVFELVDGQWAALGSPTAKGSAAVLPSLAYDGTGRLWLLVGLVTPTSLDYELHRWSGDWGPPVALGGGPAGGLSELGETLGLAHADNRLIAAFPVASPSASSLTIARLVTQVNPPAPPGRQPEQPAATSTTGSGPGGALDGRGGPLVAAAVTVSVVALAAAVASRRRRDRRGRSA